MHSSKELEHYLISEVLIILTSTTFILKVLAVRIDSALVCAMDLKYI